MALLDRVLQRDRKPARDSIEASRMSVIEHLEALRRALIISLAAWGVATAISFVFSTRVLEFLKAQSGVHHLVYLNPAGGFVVLFKVALYMGIVIASPILIQQIWWFVSPGLHRHERRLVAPLVVFTILFFALGIAAAIYALPFYIKILTGFAPPGVDYLGDVDGFLGFVLTMIIGFGLMFELPVVLFVLGMVRIISSKWLYKNRVYWVLGLGLAANFLTPGVDPITPFIMFVPLYIFFEGTALTLKLVGR